MINSVDKTIKHSVQLPCVFLIGSSMSVEIVDCEQRRSDLTLSRFHAIFDGKRNRKAVLT